MRKNTVKYFEFGQAVLEEMSFKAFFFFFSPLFCEVGLFGQYWYRAS